MIRNSEQQLAREKYEESLKLSILEKQTEIEKQSKQREKEYAKQKVKTIV